MSTIHRPAGERRPVAAIGSMGSLSADRVAAMTDAEVEAALRELEGPQ